MLRMRFASQTFVGLVWLAGCGSGDDTSATPPAFAETLPAVDASGTPPSGSPEAQPSPTAPSTNPSPEGTDSGLGLEPGAAPPGAGEPAEPEQPEVPALLFGNGRIVGADCTLVCADASTDPDAQGQTDGWGFERGRSCLTPQSDLALENEPCDIPE